MSEWQPIETAPKDGTPFDAFARHKSGLTVRIPHVHLDLDLKEPRWWSSYSGASDDAGCKRGGYLNTTAWTLTHWMPIPEPPK